MNTKKLSIQLIAYSIVHRIQEFFGIKRGKVYFEYLYSKKDDVWDYKTSEYELNKYRKSVNALGSQHYSSVLEIGCSIGVFTRMLTDIADDVTAIDISSIAVAKAKKECEDKNNVAFFVGNFGEYKATKQFDLICAAEVLYYLSDNKELIQSVVSRIYNMLLPGGALLYVCGSWEVDKFNDWEAYFQVYSDEKLELINIDKIPDEFNNYRIAMLRKRTDDHTL